MAFYKQDIVDIDLNSGNIFRSFLNHSIGYKDDDADRFGVRVFRDKEPVDLSGASCEAVFMAPNGVNIALTSYGTVSGNEAFVTLPQACYDYEGQFCLAIKLVGGGVTGTVRIIDGMVVNTGASGAVTPTASVPTYQEILSTYEAMVAATSAANLAIAETFDATKAYPDGKYVINSGALYRLTADHAANVTWANTSKVATNFGDELSSVESALSKLLSPTIKIGRYNPQKHEEAQSTDAKTCFTSLMPCKDDVIYIPSVLIGYKYCLHLYDSNFTYLPESDTSWQDNGKYFSNKGGYYALSFCKSPWGDFNSTDTAKLFSFYFASKSTCIIDELEINENEPAQFYIPQSADRINLIGNIYCKSEAVTIPQIVGYVYAYDIKDSSYTITESGLCALSKTFHNKGGYIFVSYRKIISSTYTSDDVSTITDAFRLKNRLDILEEYAKDSVIFDRCYGFNPSNMSTETNGTNAPRRCFTSLIYCNSNTTYIKAIDGYENIVYIYDSTLTCQNTDAEFIFDDTIIHNNKGYIVVVYRKQSNGQEMTAADVLDISSKFIMEQPYNVKIKQIADVINLEEEKQISAYIPTSADRININGRLRMDSKKSIIPYINGYAFTYDLYDEYGDRIYQGNLNFGLTREESNAGGSIFISWKKIDGTAPTSDDVAVIQNNFRLLNKIDEIDSIIKNDIDFTVCYRTNIPQQEVSITGTNKSRCYTSMIYCNENELLIPYIEGYPYIVYLFNSNREYIREISDSFLSSNVIVNNKGGYVVCLFRKPNEANFTSADIENLQIKFGLHSGANLAISFKQRTNYRVPVITVFDDDGKTGFIEEAEMLAERNATGTSAIITGSVGINNRMTLEQILALKEAGHDFVSHTNTHSADIYGNNYSGGRYCNMALVTDETIYNDLKLSRDYLLKYGLNADALAWPWGGYPTGYNEHTNNPDPNDANVCGAEDQRFRYAKIAREVGFKYAVNSSGGLITSCNFDDMWIQRYAIMADDESHPLSEYTALVDACVDQCGWLIFMTHASDPVYANLTKLTNIIDYAITKGCLIKNFREAYQIKGHIASCGVYRDTFHHLHVGADGVMYT